MGTSLGPFLLRDSFEMDGSWFLELLSLTMTLGGQFGLPQGHPDFHGSFN